MQLICLWFYLFGEGGGDGADGDVASSSPFKTTKYIQIFLIGRLHDYRIES